MCFAVFPSELTDENLKWTSSPSAGRWIVYQTCQAVKFWSDWLINSSWLNPVSSCFVLWQICTVPLPFVLICDGPITAISLMWGRFDTMTDGGASPVSHAFGCSDLLEDCPVQSVSVCCVLSKLLCFHYSSFWSLQFAVMASPSWFFGARNYRIWTRGK